MDIQKDLTKFYLWNAKAREKFTKELADVGVKPRAPRLDAQAQAKKNDYAQKEQKPVEADARKSPKGFEVDDGADEATLKERLELMKSDDKAKNEDLEKLLDKQVNTEKRMAKCQDDANQKNTEIGKLQAEVARQGDDIAAHGRFAYSLAKKYELEVPFSFPVSPDQVNVVDLSTDEYAKGARSFTTAMEGKVDDQQVKLMSAASDFENGLKQARDAHNKFQSSLLESETKLKQQDGEYDAADEELQIVNADATSMSKYRSSIRNIDDTRNKAQAAKDALTNYKSDPRFGQLAGNLKEAEKRKRDLESEIGDLRGVQELAQSREDEDKRYGIQETEIQNSLHELDVSLDQNRKLFLSALDMAPQLVRKAWNRPTRRSRIRLRM